ncbi:hypothetical protein GRF29_185g620473 [Pseudopithomyces chartarum]|uniref:Uncharacterized protein n=1 Tax=Pseudopithomyces chartarum TaxID=1892770 RepID=A0AAN6LN08_9PLEO|nr:hypothetical protein GRF29_185g620473 [Pseudopithomyces chartarum]
MRFITLATILAPTIVVVQAGALIPPPCCKNPITTSATEPAATFTLTASIASPPHQTPGAKPPGTVSESAHTYTGTVPTAIPPARSRSTKPPPLPTASGPASFVTLTWSGNSRSSASGN